MGWNGIVSRAGTAARAAVRRGAWLLRLTVDYALPPRCPGCGAIAAEDHRFCAPCWIALDFGRSDRCPRCGERLALTLADEPCGGCQAAPPAYDRMAAAVAYGPIARAIVLRLKHGRRTGLARTVAGSMAPLVPIDGATIVAPVPLHRWRLWRRGYNQAALIARHVARERGGRFVPDLLLRTRATPMLRGLGRRARAQTVRGAFALAPGWQADLRGRRVVLVDDVLTTGATAEACARVLKRAGAADVALLTWAREDRDGGAGVDDAMPPFGGVDIASPDQQVARYGHGG